MSGIFGVGLGEILLIVMVLLIVGGPRNVAKWSYEAGRMLRQLGQYWSQMMAEINKELDPETKELLNATQELKRGLQEVQNATDPRKAFSSINKQLQIEEKPASQPEAKPETPAGNGRYNDWMPRKDNEPRP